MAEGVGFEPTVELPLHGISSAAPSATRPPLLHHCDLLPRAADLRFLCATSICSTDCTATVCPNRLAHGQHGFAMLRINWRRGEDLNPRGTCAPIRFRVGRLQPGSATPPRQSSSPLKELAQYRTTLLLQHACCHHGPVIEAPVF